MWTASGELTDDEEETVGGRIAIFDERGVMIDHTVFTTARADEGGEGTRETARGNCGPARSVAKVSDLRQERAGAEA